MNRAQAQAQDRDLAQGDLIRTPGKNSLAATMLLRTPRRAPSSLIAGWTELLPLFQQRFLCLLRAPCHYRHSVLVPVAKLLFRWSDPGAMPGLELGALMRHVVGPLRVHWRLGREAESRSWPDRQSAAWFEFERMRHSERSNLYESYQES